MSAHEVKTQHVYDLLRNGLELMDGIDTGHTGLVPYAYNETFDTDDDVIEGFLSTDGQTFRITVELVHEVSHG